MAKRKGKLIVLEGVTRSGKSTQAKLVAAALADLGYNVSQDAEPTGGPFGRVIRAVIERRREDAPCAEAIHAANSLFRGRSEIENKIVSVLRAIWQGEYVSFLDMQLIFMADRCWHCAFSLRPLLDAGVNVICDRYAPSTLAFGFGHGVELGELVHWHYRILDKNYIVPALTIYVEIPSGVAIERMADGKVNDIFETKMGIEGTIQAYEDVWKFGRSTRQFGTMVYVRGDRPIPKVTENILFEARRILDI